MGTSTFGYDNLSRLATASVSQPGNPYIAYCWDYDSFGNRQNEEGSTASFVSGTGGQTPCQAQANAQLTNTWATYNSSNQITATTRAPAGPSYDAAGDVTFDGTDQYVYDGDGHVCAVKGYAVDGMTWMVGYVYDAEGRRVAKGTIASLSCDPSTNGFAPMNDEVLGQQGEQVTELGMDVNGMMAWQHTNVYANGAQIAAYDADGVHFLLGDWEGTRRAQTDYAGVLEQTCQSLPFGGGLACTVSNQAPTEQLFAGMSLDPESALYHALHREYDSFVGRWTVPDPYNGSYNPLDPQSMNRYSYVQNHPLTFTDPSGQAGGGVLTGVGGSACGSWRMDSMNPCSPLVSIISLGIDKILGFQQLSFAAGSVAPILSFGITFGCGFESSSDTKSSFCGQSGWTALFSKDHPDLATGINDGIAAVGLADGLAIASAASTAGVPYAAYLASCFAGPENIACDVAVALAVYTALNDIVSLFCDLLSCDSSPQFKGSLQPRPADLGGLGTSPIGIPNQNLSLRDLTNQ
ncbi:MAG: RHS repeat domain-containing protein [Acidobacteriaceae bacterium]